MRRSDRSEVRRGTGMAFEQTRQYVIGTTYCFAVPTHFYCNCKFKSENVCEAGYAWALVKESNDN